MKTTRTALAGVGALGCLVLAMTASAATGKFTSTGAKAPAGYAKTEPVPGPTLSAEEERAKANAEQAKAAQEQNAQNAANQQAYQDALKARDAEIARQKAEYDAAMKKWEEDTAACKAGDTSRCAKPN